MFPHVLSQTDRAAPLPLALLDQFVTVRGGTLVLLPEQRIISPADRLITGTWSEHLTPTPQRIGPLFASEILTAGDLRMATVIAASEKRPSIVSLPSGNGRVILSGAMDAWRHRDRDAGGFDRFWRAVVAEGAAAAASPSLSLQSSLIASGARTRFVLRDRRMAPESRPHANATMRCGDAAASSVRLWPDSDGVFAGEVTATAGHTCLIEAMINGRRAEGSFAVVDRPSLGVRATIARLTGEARRSGGVVINSDADSVRFRPITDDRQASSQIVSTRPMRAGWWMIPFAACLTVEWWLRRREGLR